MLSINTLLQNRYLILRQIGNGGMGAVYEARHRQLKNTVAVKETIAPDEFFRRALEHEAQLLANLRHPALPKIIDHFTEGDSQFMVMEYIGGKDLAEMLQERGTPFSAENVICWGVQLLETLDYLHTHEPPIIHRDIKPNNLKLTAQGELILLDFGLSKGSAFTSSISNNRSLFGYSLNYSPPEQIQGKGTDERSDLYSVGATLYHLLTNTPPPDAVSRAVNLASGQGDLLHWANEVNTAVPRDVAAVLHSAMAFVKDQRPPSAAVMSEVLQNAISFSASQNTKIALPARKTKSNYEYAIPTAPLNKENPTNVNKLDSEVVRKISEPARQDLATEKPEAQSVNEGADEPITPNVNLRQSEQTWAETINRRKWMVIVGIVVAILATFGMVYFFRDKSDKHVSPSANNTAPPVSSSLSPPPTATEEKEAKPVDSSLSPSTPPVAKAEKKAASQTTTPTIDTQTSDKQEKKETQQPLSKDSSKEKKKKSAQTTTTEEQKDRPPETTPPFVYRSGGALTGSAIRRVEPSYPPMARAARVTGTVVVEVTIDEQGNVIAAKAISGPPLLKAAAVAAARGWKFTPTQLSGVPVKVKGTITFNFNM